ncbi:hypothetical protein C0J50_8349 [Silurus asotus]|uniref:Gypsy retrotransposon integrase-like protein 1 n=1 Tax=Silurus asotus TaxID=30991 RepID=A0AAD5B5M1_SILAS|nr:hypothetical protein C0J50_8349 [Silurus asotus]
MISTVVRSTPEFEACPSLADPTYFTVTSSTSAYLRRKERSNRRRVVVVVAFGLVFDGCRKDDLLLIADFFNVSLCRTSSKKVVKAALYEALVAQQVLPERDAPPGGAAQITQPTQAPGRAEAVTEPEEVELSHEQPHARTVDPGWQLALKELEVEIKRQEYQTQFLRVRERELEIEGKKLDLADQWRKPVPLPRTFRSSTIASPSPVATEHSRPPSTPAESSTVSPLAFDVSRHIGLVPVFRENEVDAYFAVFERIATTLNWPKGLWTLLLQCKLSGKAQEACSALTLGQSLDYETMKATVLRAYERVPEAYRQNFRNTVKSASQTYVEFAREKATLLEKWCSASGVSDFNQLKELILLEEFKSCLPEQLVVHLNEQKIDSLAKAAIFSDEFVLTYKVVFSPPSSRKVVSAPSPGSKIRTVPSSSDGSRRCFYCHEAEHVIANCPVLRRKQLKQQTEIKKVNAVVVPQSTPDEIEPVFKSFVFSGYVSFGVGQDKQPVSILRDTGSAQTFVRENTLSFSEASYAGSDVLIQGIGMEVIRVPLHIVYLEMENISRLVKVAVRSELPVAGVSVILGNDVAGTRVFSLPEVVSEPVSISPSPNDMHSSVFPVCVLTRAQQRKLGDVVDLSVPFLSQEEPVEESSEPLDVLHEGCADDGFKIDQPVTRDQLVAAQKSDPSLTQCFELAANQSSSERYQSMYRIEDWVLMRKWSPVSPDDRWLETFQLVVPCLFRKHVLSLAHDHPCSGHAGIRKTYRRILRYFFWPGIKSDVIRYCKTCHTCQVVGKPNQVVPPAPLNPIVVSADPFERIIVDCVGPLPKTSSGNCYLLTVMCAASRFPEAFPMRTLKSKAVVKALIRFFTTFGLPRYVQTDRGTNFTSQLFSQVMRVLQISHQCSSAYHPESQGALERFHQPFKTMLRAFCVESGKDWDEGVPLLLFAVRDAVQESLGFSPSDLVFGHTVRGPLKALQEQWLAKGPPPLGRTILKDVRLLRERLQLAREKARIALGSSQEAMKKRYDRKAVSRSFCVGDFVLALLPVPGSSLQTRFAGPAEYSPEVDELHLGRNCMSSLQVPNSEPLERLSEKLEGLPQLFQKDIKELISRFPKLFANVPSLTNVLEHDIDVGGHEPIRQHPYRISPAKRAIMKQEIDYLLENGLAVPSVSPWCSPCLLVPKADGSVRFCTDFRKVSNLGLKDLPVVVGFWMPCKTPVNFYRLYNHSITVSQVGSLIIVGDQAHHNSVISKLFEELDVATQSYVYSEYSRGLRTQPWGPPVLRVHEEVTACNKTPVHDKLSFSEFKKEEDVLVAAQMDFDQNLYHQLLSDKECEYCAEHIVIQHGFNPPGLEFSCTGCCWDPLPLLDNDITELLGLGQVFESFLEAATEEAPSGTTACKLTCYSVRRSADQWVFLFCTL